MTSPLNLTRREVSGPITPESAATSVNCFDLCESRSPCQLLATCIRDCSGLSAANVTTIRPPRRSRWHVEPTTDPERDGRAATTQNLLFRKVMVDAVVAISLAKPSKPA